MVNISNGNMQPLVTKSVEISIAFALSLVVFLACRPPDDTTAPGVVAGAKVYSAKVYEEQLLPCSYTSQNSEDSDGFTERVGCARYDESGELVVLDEHLDAATGGKIRATVLVAGRWYYLLPDGKSLEVIFYDNGPDDFSEGLARGRRNGKIGYWNERLEPVIAPRYDWGWPFEGGLALVCSGCRKERLPGEEHTSLMGGSWGVIDIEGNEAIALGEDRAAVVAELDERLAGDSVDRESGSPEASRP